MNLDKNVLVDMETIKQVLAIGFPNDASLVQEIKNLVSNNSPLNVEINMANESSLGNSNPSKVVPIIMPDENLVQQVNDIFNNHAHQMDEGITDRVVCSIENDLGGINSTLPISASANPFAVLATIELGFEDNPIILASPKSCKNLPIVQTTLVFSASVVSPRRGRPPNNLKTQMEIDVGIQKTLSLSPIGGKERHSVSLGRHNKTHIAPVSVKIKRSKRFVTSPPVTRSGIVKRNLQDCFGESKNYLINGKRGASASPRGQ